MKVLKIIDGNALLFRAYFASSYSGVSLTTSSGIPTNAVYVFANMLQKILFPVDQDVHILVAFDTGEKTFRHQELESYKAHRKPVPEDLIPQFSIARGLLNALNLFTFEQSGFEGDDVAGTAAMLGLKAGMEVEIYTSDRDFLQLVQPHLTVHLIRKGVSEMVKMTREKVIEEYGITPEQVPDYKGLVGDASDNLPGIPGIGDKTAVKLLQQFSTFEKVLEAASTLKGKTAENLITHQQSGILSKKLAMIQTNMNLPFQLEQTLYQGIQQDQFLQFVTQYEMKSLLGRFQKKTKETATELVFEKVKALPDGTYKQISIVPLIKQGNYFQSTLEGWVIHHQSQTYLLSLEDSQHDQVWQRIMQDKEVEKISFDYKELIVLCHRYHIQLDGPFFDCMLATYAIEENPSLNRQAVMQQVGITLSEDLVEQSVQVAQALLPMKNKLVEQLKEKQLEKIVYEIEFPLIPVLASMEIEGIPIDVPYLKNMEKNVAEKIDDLKKQIFSLMGQTFNLDSPKQLSEILFTTLQLPNPKKGSTNIEVLKQLSPLHPSISFIIEYRKFAKLLSTYIKALPDISYPDGKLHPIYQQAQTTTGRLSSYDPNIQNIAVKDEDTKLIRKAFYYPNEDDVLLSFDYSQIELRILAELANCQPLIEAFHQQEDIHTLTAKRLFANGSEVTPLMRRQAKAVNFGIIYGISSWGLSEQLGVSPSEANQLIDAFYLAYPELKQYMQSLILSLQEQKFVSTLLGRRRYLREISGSNFQAREFAKRAAMNAPIQGTAADLLKLAMIKVDAALKAKGFKTKLILTIHDELIFKTPQMEIETVMPLIQQIMETALPLKVPLKVDGHYAKTWYDLK
ncbi:MAG: DNA polymerase I [Bacilli bacterium]